MDITKIEGIEKIDKFFYPHIKKMCSIANNDAHITKVVAFGPIVNHEKIDENTELFFGVYFDEDYIKNFSDDDFVDVTADIEEEINMVWVCAPQNHRYDESKSFKEDVEKGVIIYASTGQGKKG